VLICGGIFQVVTGLFSVFASNLVLAQFTVPIDANAKPQALLMVQFLGILSLFIGLFALASVIKDCPTKDCLTTKDCPTKENLGAFAISFLAQAIFIAASMADHSFRELGVSDLSTAGYFVYAVLMSIALFLAEPGKQGPQEAERLK